MRAMGSTTGGREEKGGSGKGFRTPKIWMDPRLFMKLFRGGLMGLRQTGYTFLNFFPEKGSDTPDREIGPPNFENVVAPPRRASDHAHRCAFLYVRPIPTDGA